MSKANVSRAGDDAATAATVPPADSTPAPAMVLLVEDESDIASVMAEALEDEGYRVTRAASGTAALSLLPQVQPDLIVLDLMLPDVDGLILCSDVRARTSAPILICSASQRQRDRVLSLRLGGNAFLAKPFDLDDLLARVDALICRSLSRSTASAPAPRPPAA